MTPVVWWLAIAAIVAVPSACERSQLNGNAPRPEIAPPGEPQALEALVGDAASLIRTTGEAAFPELRVPNSRFRQAELYVFVLDLEGNMLVHPDATMEGKNELELEDVAGKPIIRGLLEAATAQPAKPFGWYHYQWPVPGGLFPRWKSSYVRLVTAPSGKSYVVGSGVYDDRMERAFVVDLVKDAVGEIEAGGAAAFARLRDPKDRFIAKDAYVFVIDPNGLDLVNPGFPNLEGRNLRDVTDTRGKKLVQEMLRVAQAQGAGWVDYLWPKPGESVSTVKSTYVQRAAVGDSWVLVGCGVYLADAPKTAPVATRLTAPRMASLVREAAALLEQQGEKAYSQLRTRGSKWFHDDTYFFVWSMDGTRLFHAADPSLEGKSAVAVKDVLGRPYGQMMLDAAAGPSGEGWVHYQYPEPGSLFPAWKSTFVKRVVLPSGETRLVGAGVYDLQMDKAFIEDVVDRAAALVAERGRGAFDQLRDKTGPFVFMDVYVFVDTPDGVEQVNAAQPSLEGKNLLELKDVNGKAVTREAIEAATKRGSAWVEYSWFKPGHNTAVKKQAYVRLVRSGPDVFIVGSGMYAE